jgi:hypothetical protein
MYAVMRIVDDRVDQLAVSAPLSSDKRRRELEVLQAWHGVVSACLAGRSPSPQERAATNHPDAEGLAVALTAAVNRFPVPPELWDDSSRDEKRIANTLATEMATQHLSTDGS